MRPYGCTCPAWRVLKANELTGFCRMVDVQQTSVRIEHGETEMAKQTKKNSALADPILLSPQDADGNSIQVIVETPKAAQQVRIRS